MDLIVDNIFEKSEPHGLFYFTFVEFYQFDSKILALRMQGLIDEDFAGPLESLAEYTWTGKELYAIIYRAVKER